MAVVVRNKFLFNAITIQAGFFENGENSQLIVIFTVKCVGKLSLCKNTFENIFVHPV
jgi:hypothetical protein